MSHIWQLYQLKTTEGLKKVFDYSIAVCMLLLPPKSELHSYKKKIYLKLWTLQNFLPSSKLPKYPSCADIVEDPRRILEGWIGRFAKFSIRVFHFSPLAWRVAAEKYSRGSEGKNSLPSGVKWYPRDPFIFWSPEPPCQRRQPAISTCFARHSPDVLFFHRPPCSLPENSRIFFFSVIAFFFATTQDQECFQLSTAVSVLSTQKSSFFSSGA